MDIVDELRIAAIYERHGGRAFLMVQASEEIKRLRRYAGLVCELDWSDNDEDAVRRIENLRGVITETVSAGYNPTKDAVELMRDAATPAAPNPPNQGSGR